MIKKIIRTLLLIFCTVMVTSCAQSQKGTEEVLLEFEEQYIKEHNYDPNSIIATYTDPKIRITLLRDGEELKAIMTDHRFGDCFTNEVVAKDFYGSFCVTYSDITWAVVFFDSDEVNSFSFNLLKNAQSWIRIHETDLQQRGQQIYFYQFDSDYQLLQDLKFE
ncbi:hypothetical protein [Allobaculum stercoricanis]|uniref:hypothetical protein n=1 Tax=Allobaculum stercoricanis TaxID=174709 RepID=UPI0029437BFB|nr:hypothetical protein [Allobaculum stercoricanis]